MLPFDEHASVRLSGKIAVVTGATRGIGRACALALAREGADVLVSGRDAQAGAGACAEIAALGRRAKFHAADLSQTRAARGVVDAALAEFGALDVLVNNAGIFERAPVLDLEEDAARASQRPCPNRECSALTPQCPDRPE